MFLFIAHCHPCTIQCTKNLPNSSSVRNTSWHHICDESKYSEMGKNSQNAPCWPTHHSIPPKHTKPEKSVKFRTLHRLFSMKNEDVEICCFAPFGCEDPPTTLTLYYRCSTTFNQSCKKEIYIFRLIKNLSLMLCYPAHAENPIVLELISFDFLPPREANSKKI